MQRAASAEEAAGLLLTLLRGADPSDTDTLQRVPRGSSSDGRRAPEPPGQSPPKLARLGAGPSGRRAYTWRGPARAASKAHQLPQQPAASADSHHSCASATACDAPGDECRSQQQQQQQQAAAAAPSTAGIKQWSALTTWLRMNLSHPRTAKRLVLFIGRQDARSGTWAFALNAGLVWSDVSSETQLRLKTLPLEAEQAFRERHPRRPLADWGSKCMKYVPPGSSSGTAHSVSLLDVALSLNRLFWEHSGESLHAQPLQLQQAVARMRAAASPPLPLSAEAQLPAAAPAVAWGLPACWMPGPPQQLAAPWPGMALPGWGFWAAPASQQPGAVLGLPLPVLPPVVAALAAAGEAADDSSNESATPVAAARSSPLPA